MHQSERTPEATMLLEILRVLQAEPDYGMALRQIQEIEQRHIAALGADEQLALRRSAAHMAFVAATDLSAPFNEVSARFQAICQLGFSSPHSEIAVFLEFAGACGSFGHREEGLRVLAQARERLPESRLKAQAEVSRLIEGCRQRLLGGEEVEQDGC